jgi:hypothetical protein
MAHQAGKEATMMKKKPADEHKPRGRKPTRVVKLDATP